MNRTATLSGSVRFCFAVILCSLGSSIAFAQLDVFVDDDNHFVMQSDGFELLGIQFESASGSLVPGAPSETGPFELSLTKSPSIVMFGSLNESVRVEGEVKLPTQWNSEGQRDVGFRWGSQDDDGSHAVVGHEPQFVTQQSSSATTPDDSAITIGLEPQGTPSITTSPIFGGAVASSTSDIVTGGSTSSLQNSEIPGYVGLELLDDPLFVYLAWNPSFESLTVASAGGLLEPQSFDASGVTVISQNEFEATYAFDDSLPDGAYSLPLRWLGSDAADVSLSIFPPDESVSLEVLGGFGIALPEPSGLSLTLVVCCGLPLLRRGRR